MNVSPEFGVVPVDFTVTFVTQVGRVEVVSADGQSVGEPGQLEPQLTEMAADRLAELSVTFGSAKGMEHLAAADIINHPDTDFEPVALAAACSALAGVLPRQAFNYIGTSEQPIAVSLGRLGVAARRPTIEEMQEHKEVQILRADAEKLDLTTYDHAVITVDGEQYVLPFESLGTRLAARTVEAIVALGQDSRNIETQAIVRRVWRSMPFAERALFCSTENQTRGACPRSVRNAILAALSGPVNILGVARRGQLGSITRMTADQIGIAYSTAPQEDYSAVTVLRAQARAGLRLSEQQGQQIPDADLAQARTAIGYASQYQTLRLEHQPAVGLVEFIMTTEGKRALIKVLQDSGSALSYTDAYDRLHDIARKSLTSSSYRSTCDSMVIGRFSWTSASHVRQVSGGLPADTTRADLGIGVRWVLEHPTGQPIS